MFEALLQTYGIIDCTEVKRNFVWSCLHAVQSHATHMCAAIAVQGSRASSPESVSELPVQQLVGTPGEGP